MMAGVDMLHVPYRGGPAAVTDLIGGRVQVLFLTTSAAMAYIRSRQVRPLAVGSQTRSPTLPDIPTVAEFVPGFEASNFYGIGVPTNTPPDIIDRLNRELSATLADPAMIARLADLGATPMPSSPAEFGKLVADETEKWAKVVKFAGLKPE
jgi:tripartite-type tricarboxylate transporter receptor subunit TctC